MSKNGPLGQSVLFIVANVDFNDYITRKVRKDMSAHLADTKTQTALIVLLAFGGSSDVLNWIARPWQELVSEPLPN